MIPRWLGPYVGVPYDELDCWALVRRIYQERFHLELPDWRVDRQGLPVETITADGPTWIEVTPEEAQLGDLLAITRGGMVYHVGLVVAPGWMLHSLEGLESALERYDNFIWRSRLAGIFRHPQMLR